jgi:hypothetical protein
MHCRVFPLVIAASCLSLAAIAGDLEPGAPPGPTMKSLDEIPPTWSQRLDSTDGSTIPITFGCDSSRFECIWSEGSPVPLPRAVLDKETGLVWERSPSYTDEPWDIAVVLCHALEIGGRFGWRLPTVEELASLIDRSQASPALPEDHPFLNIQFGSGDTYWTRTVHPVDPDDVWFASFGTGFVNVLPNSVLRHVWCVRGGHDAGGH